MRVILCQPHINVSITLDPKSFRFGHVRGSLYFDVTVWEQLALTTPTAGLTAVTYEDNPRRSRSISQHAQGIFPNQPGKASLSLKSIGGLKDRRACYAVALKGEAHFMRCWASTVLVVDTR